MIQTLAAFCARKRGRLIAIAPPPCARFCRLGRRTAACQPYRPAQLGCERTPLLAVLQHVGWPCARRDMYYAPGSIPAEYRQPCSHDAEVTLDDPSYRIDRGYRGAGDFAWALQADGPENGVLTAIEDFCCRAESGSRRLLYTQIPAVFGLGVLFDADAPWAVAVAEALIPFHENPLLARLETNRLRNYLPVLDWQDGHIARPY